MNINFIPADLQHRNYYLEKVRPFMGKGLIKVFTGQRRVGKSYLMFQLMEVILKENKNSHICYINKENLAFDFIKTGNDLNDYVLSHKKGKTYVFIDEIQDIEGFESALRSLLLDKDLDIYCTGSNANLLSGDIAGQLSGRYIEIVVYSLSYIEFLQFHKCANTSKNFEKYMKYGGLPYLKHLPLNDDVVFEYLKNIYNTIVYKDIINRFEVRNVRFLEQLVLFLANNTGSLFSGKKISDYLKSQKVNIGTNQVLTYMDYLVNAFIIHRVSRYDIIGKKIFETGEKYYFENLGIRHGIWGFRMEDRGKILENIVYNHLLFCGYKVTVGTLAKEEIDFVCEKNGEKLYLQVALTIQNENTLAREFGNLTKINDNYPKWVITMEESNTVSYQGIVHKNARNFLSEVI